MKKIILGLLLTMSSSAFAEGGFDCTRLKDLSAKDLALAMEFAETVGSFRIDLAMGAVNAADSDRIKMQRNFSSDLLECKKTVLEAKTQQ